MTNSQIIDYEVVDSAKTQGGKLHRHKGYPGLHHVWKGWDGKYRQAGDVENVPYSLSAPNRYFHLSLKIACARLRNSQIVVE